MAIQHPDIQPAVNHSVQVAIAGAGPVGLMMANYLGQMGIDVLVVEKLDKLIDYPGESPRCAARYLSTRTSRSRQSDD